MEVNCWARGKRDQHIGKLGGKTLITLDKARERKTNALQKPAFCLGKNF